VAVRSSATAEDLADASFAGQQETYLNVRGDDELLAAVVRCWASLWTDRAITYRARQRFDAGGLRLAVVVQRMVPAGAAGVMFTANPTNGRRDEVMITAAWGLGEAVVSGAVDTDTLVVAKADGRVRHRSIADKAVETAYVANGTAERPVPEERRRAAVLRDAAAAELARLGRRVEDHFGAPQDIEWARTTEGFVLLQARPITALPPVEADPPTDWTVPDPTAMYVRASIVEQLPDPLTPLFADLVGTSVTRSIQALFRELLGRNVITDADVDLPTVNGYAYYRYSRAGMLRLGLGSRKAFKFLFTPSGAQDRWRDQALPAYRATVAQWSDRPVSQLTGTELVAGVTELLDAGTTYYTAVQTIIPIAATSEVVFTRLYETLVQRDGDPPAATFLLGSDSLPIAAEKSLFDLATWTRSQRPLGRDGRPVGRGRRDRAAGGRVLAPPGRADGGAGRDRERHRTAERVGGSGGAAEAGVAGSAAGHAPAAAAGTELDAGVRLHDAGDHAGAGRRCADRDRGQRGPGDRHGARARRSG